MLESSLILRDLPEPRFAVAHSLSGQVSTASNSQAAGAGAAGAPPAASPPEQQQQPAPPDDGDKEPTSIDGSILLLKRNKITTMPLPKGHGATLQAFLLQRKLEVHPLYGAVRIVYPLQLPPLAILESKEALTDHLWRVATGAPSSSSSAPADNRTMMTTTIDVSSRSLFSGKSARSLLDLGGSTRGLVDAMNASFTALAGPAAAAAAAAGGSSSSAYHSGALTLRVQSKARVDQFRNHHRYQSGPTPTKIVEEEEEEEVASQPTNPEQQKQQAPDSFMGENLWRELCLLQLFANSSTLEGAKWIAVDGTGSTLYTLTNHALLPQSLLDYCLVQPRQLPDDVVEAAAIMEDTARMWFGQILASLEALADQGICHRNLSLANFIISPSEDEDGVEENTSTTKPNGGSGKVELPTVTLRLSRHGLALPLDLQAMSFPCVLPPPATADPLYMAPELFLGEPCASVSSSDIWSAGICLLQIILHLSAPLAVAAVTTGPIPLCPEESLDPKRLMDRQAQPCVSIPTPPLLFAAPLPEDGRFQAMVQNLEQHLAQLWKIMCETVIATKTAGSGEDGKTDDTVTLPSEPWSHLLVDLLRGMLRAKPEERLTLAQIRSHPWINTLMTPDQKFHERVSL